MHSRLPLRLLLAGMLASCGPAGAPAALASLVSGTLSGTVGTEFPDPIRVRVTDRHGDAVGRVEVVFDVTEGAGYVGEGTERTSSATVSTDELGEAGVFWKLGGIAGSQSVRATVEGVAPVTVHATALPGSPAQVFVDPSTAVVSPVGAPTDEPLAVVVRDAFNNAVAGATVAWSALTAGTSVAAATTISDSTGVARVGAALGPAQYVYLFQASLAGTATVDTIGVLGVVTTPDPEGDAIPTGDPGFPTHDVTRLGAAVVNGVLALYAHFAGPVTLTLPNEQPTSHSLLGYYDVDLDQDSTTGFLPFRQCLGGAPLGLGADLLVDVAPTLDTGENVVLRADTLRGDRCTYFNDDGTPTFVGKALVTRPLVRPMSVTFFLPLTFLLDDGAFAMTSLFGSAGTGQLTDIAPDSAAWVFAGATPAPPRTVSVGAASLTGLRYLALPPLDTHVVPLAEGRRVFRRRR
jgi:hypothetical protein